MLLDKFRPVMATAPTQYAEPCPNCAGSIEREHRSWQCPNCGHAPNHGAD